ARAARRHYIGTRTVTLRGRALPLPGTSTVTTHSLPRGCADRSSPPVCATTWAAAALQSPEACTTPESRPVSSAPGRIRLAARAAVIRGEAMNLLSGPDHLDARS